MSLKIRFRFDGKCSRHPRYTRDAMDGHQTRNVTVANRCTSFIFTRRLHRRGHKAKGSLGIAVQALIVNERRATIGSKEANFLILQTRPAPACSTSLPDSRQSKQPLKNRS